VAPHWYATALEAQRTADAIEEALGHRLQPWIPRSSLLKTRSLTTCVVCARPIEVHPYWEDGRFIGFLLTGAALGGVYRSPAGNADDGRDPRAGG
jgi:hypothetical protein